jgi:hemerythrin
MALFEWTDDFSVGIHSIDMQHQGLFKTFNDLYESLQTGDALAIEKALGDMWQYTCDHFEYEEKYFARHKYPDAAPHKAEHAALAAQVSDQIAKFNSGELTLTSELAEFLGSWLKNHINGVDKKYSAFFKAKGVR